ncbi:Protein CBG27996 [Caenorhabditis briggsae]|uniref:Protein CBG27996 n=1 Tax=Caenorhabditis briggsae TaxID=6238 RepID=B6IM57_CAEBR|nr:Protein CBG27996 [Caenorhabditis briggsae]CAS00987.1 Protein CBG27996 [Caenorhabditis briggsae]
MEEIQVILGDIEIEEDDREVNHAEEEDNNYDSDASIF